MKKIIAAALGLATVVLLICTYQSLTKGGVTYVMEVIANPKNESNAKEPTEMVAQCCEILRKRCNYIGVTGEKVYSLEQEGHPNRIKMELEGTQDTERMKKLFTGSANLEFWETYSPEDIQANFINADKKLYSILAEVPTDAKVTNTSHEDALGSNGELRKEYPLRSLILPNQSPFRAPIIGCVNSQDTAIMNTYLNMPEIQMEFPKDLRLLWAAFPVDFDNGKNLFELYAIKSTESNGRAPLDQSVIIDVESVIDQYGRPCLDINMNEEGARNWARMTKKNIGRSIAIVSNNYVYSAPSVNSEIVGGRSQVAGNLNEEEAQDLASILKSGVMPASVNILEENIMSDDQWSINKSLLICTLICGLAFVFMLIKVIKDK